MSQPNAAAKALLKRLENALRNMTWVHHPVKPADFPPDVKAKPYDGVWRKPSSALGALEAGQPLDEVHGVAAPDEHWTCVVVAYLDPASVSPKWRYDGAATDLRKGVIVHLPPEMAEMAVNLAQAMVEGTKPVSSGVIVRDVK